MEYVYAALLLHKLKKEINEDNLKNVVKATGVEPDEIKVKALVAALNEINIDEALKSAPVSIAAPTAPAAPKEAPKEAKVEEEETKKGEEEAMAGLSALFG